jgi:hypothetical protein
VRTSLAYPDHGSLPQIRGRVGLRIAMFRGLLSVYSSLRPISSPRRPLHRGLQPFRFLHDCSDYFRLERLLPGWDSHPLEDRAFARRTRKKRHVIA